MRPDMAKVIVERPRLGGGLRRPKGNRKRERLALADLAPTREGMRRPWQSCRKMLNENLGPLRRYLQSQVGRPWNKIHSEISQQLRLDSAVQSHVLDHLDDYVTQQVEIVEGRLYSRSGWPIGCPVRTEFYVCPCTGLLRATKNRWTWRRPRPPQPVVERLEIDAWRQFQRQHGIWYEIRLEPFNCAAIGRWDVILNTRVDWHLRQELRSQYGSDVFAASKRQLNKREIVRVRKLLVERTRKAGRRR
jgi:hypothetical protein